MDKDLSPEERLFKAIHQGKNIPSRKLKEKDEPEVKTFWQSIILGLFAFNSSGGQLHPTAGFPSQEQGLSLTLIRRILMFILLLLILMVLFKVIYERQQIPDLVEVDPNNNHPLALESDAIQGFQSKEFYLADVNTKDIFHPPAPKVEQVVEVQKTEEIPVGPNIQDIVKNLSLGGIYEGENLEAIVEDKELKKTYYIKQGDEIKGMKVKEILKDRVIFQLGEQQADLL